MKRTIMRADIKAGFRGRFVTIAPSHTGGFYGVEMYFRDGAWKCWQHTRERFKDRESAAPAAIRYAAQLGIPYLIGSHELEPA